VTRLGSVVLAAAITGVVAAIGHLGLYLSESVRWKVTAPVDT
jgi:hypothetical protein